MKVALVYDRVNKFGGAERVLQALHEMFPDAPLFTSVYEPSKARWADIFPDIKTTFLQKIPFLRDKHELLGWLTPIAFETLSLSGEFDAYDLVISVTSEAAKGIITKPKTLHICYCLTPTRYLWSHYDEYFKARAFRLVAAPFLKYLRKWDKTASQRPDYLIAISSAVKERISRYYGRTSEIVFPPVNVSEIQKSVKLNTHRALRNETAHKLSVVKNSYFLIVGRLVPYKKVDMVIETFNRLGLPLVVAGTGSEEKNLRINAGKNILFTGFFKDSELVYYFKNAKALVMPQEEDFGIVSVEAQAAGIPVIAYNKGGARDTVIEGKTGYFFGEQTADSLEAAVKRFNKSGKNDLQKKDCFANAKKFSKEVFRKEMFDLIEKYSKLR